MIARITATALLVAGLATHAMAAQVIVINGDPPGQGFNDPTPATPVGGNPGTTVGQQALNVFQAAANRWGATLVSDQPILVIAFFTPLTCTPTGAVLGAARAYFYFANVPSAAGGQDLAPNTWYPAALAEKITRQDIIVDPDEPFEIVAFFNSELGKPGCLTGRGWYYGLDNNEGNLIDLLAVVLHEFGHGLGASVLPTSANSGARPLGFPSIWEGQMLDLTSGKYWLDMTDSERAASARNDQNLVWAGQKATNNVYSVLDFRAELEVLQPASLGVNEAQRASFGGNVGPHLEALLVAPNDGGGSSPLDGCEPFPASAGIPGKIVLVNRGTCTFVQKALNAQNAGAIAVIIANNVPGAIAPGGQDPNVVIPAVGITQALGASLRAATLPLVDLRRNPTIRTGTGNNHPRLYAPTAFAQGSSVSHFDVTALPNVLMEPFINPELTSSVKNPDDLTRGLLFDIGWQ